MNNDRSHTNPSGDPDARLARQVGQQFMSREIDMSKDPLYRLLDGVRLHHESVESNVSIDVRSKDRLWNDIHAHIQSDSITDKLQADHRIGHPSENVKGIHTGQNYQRRRSSVVPHWWYWAAAAVVAIVMTSIFLIDRTGSPTLIASADSSIEAVILLDGSTVTLRPNTQLLRINEQDGLQHYLISGEALFEVTSNPDRTFIVDAGTARVTVTGTSFSLRERNRKSAVYLLEGSVHFESIELGSVVSLVKGQSSFIDPGSVPTLPETFDSNEILSWTRNELVFSNRTANELIEELQYHFGITILIPDAIKSELLGGSISLNDVNVTLSDLGLVLGGRFVSTSENTYEFRMLDP